jgi:hypothetical protein
LIIFENSLKIIPDFINSKILKNKIKLCRISSNFDIKNNEINQISNELKSNIKKYLSSKQDIVKIDTNVLKILTIEKKCNFFLI